MRGMEKLGYGDWKGRNVVIFGYGKVGRGVAYYCHEKGAAVMAVDRPEVVVAEYVTLVDKNDRKAIQTAVREAWCVVTATGVRHALRGNGAAEILRDGGQLVAAIGIEDEWGDELPMERTFSETARRRRCPHPLDTSGNPFPRRAFRNKRSRCWRFSRRGSAS